MGAMKPGLMEIRFEPRERLIAAGVPSKERNTHSARGI